MHLKVIAILVLLGWCLSAAIHESGHLIVGKMAGLNLEFIQIIPPAVSLSGESSRAWNAAISVSGMLCAVLVGFAGAVAVVLLQAKWPYVRYGIWVFVPMMAQALVWFGLSLVAVFGARIPDGDILKFTQNTEWPRFVVYLIGLVPVALCVAILKRVWNETDATRALQPTVARPDSETVRVNVAATLAADRAVPAAVAERGRSR